jgi:hypothetical protein
MSPPCPQEPLFLSEPLGGQAAQNVWPSQQHVALLALAWEAWNLMEANNPYTAKCEEALTAICELSCKAHSPHQGDQGQHTHSCPLSTLVCVSSYSHSPCLKGTNGSLFQGSAHLRIPGLFSQRDRNGFSVLLVSRCSSFPDGFLSRAHTLGSESYLKVPWTIWIGSCFLWRPWLCQ